MENIFAVVLLAGIVLPVVFGMIGKVRRDRVAQDAERWAAGFHAASNWPSAISALEQLELEQRERGKGRLRGLELLRSFKKLEALKKVLIKAGPAAVDALVERVTGPRIIRNLLYEITRRDSSAFPPITRALQARPNLQLAELVVDLDYAPAAELLRDQVESGKQHVYEKLSWYLSRNCGVDPQIYHKHRWRGANVTYDHYLICEKCGERWESSNAPDGGCRVWSLPFKHRWLQSGGDLRCEKCHAQSAPVSNLQDDGCSVWSPP